jgi:hypothetical protein
MSLDRASLHASRFESIVRAAVLSAADRDLIEGSLGMIIEPSQNLSTLLAREQPHLEQAGLTWARDREPVAAAAALARIGELTQKCRLSVAVLVAVQNKQLCPVAYRSSSPGAPVLWLALAGDEFSVLRPGREGDYCDARRFVDGIGTDGLPTVFLAIAKAYRAKCLPSSPAPPSQKLSTAYRLSLSFIVDAILVNELVASGELVYTDEAEHASINDFAENARREWAEALARASESTAATTATFGAKFWDQMHN